MEIGTIIKKLRKGKNITQEKFAEYLNLSPQAVSRWENGFAYPDISTIPAIASFFGVTSDLLLGIDEDKREENVQKYLSEYFTLNAEGEVQKALALMTEAKNKYPGDFRILIKYAWALAATAYIENDCNSVKTAEERNLIHQEIVSICNNIIDDCTIDNIRYNAIDLLSLAYMELGDKENAIKAAKRLPDITYASNNALYRLYDYDTEEHIQFYQDNIQNIISYMWLWIRSAACGQKDNKNKVLLFKKAIALFEIMYENGDYGFYHTMVAQIYDRLASAFIEIGDHDNALEAIEKYVEHEIEYIYALDGMKHTSILFDRLWFSGKNIMKSFTCPHAEFIYRHLENEVFAPLHDNERFHALQEKLREMF